jgi:hypothetical protein
MTAVNSSEGMVDTSHGRLTGSDQGPTIWILHTFRHYRRLPDRLSAA